MNNTPVEHHTHYEELHGFDRTVWITWDEHRNIDHRALFPGVSIERLREISQAANHRTDKFKAWSKNYEDNIRVRKPYKRGYIQFNESLMPHCRIREQIQYNYDTGNVSVSSDFNVY